MIELPYRFEPRGYQCGVFEAIIERGIKRAVCVWHRRAGKDKTFLNLLAIRAMETMGNYAYYFPTATLGRKALWDNIDARSGMKVIDHLPRALVLKTNEQQMKITLVNGSTIQVLGTDSLDVVGGNPVGVIFSESGQHRPDAWDYIRPILAENGGWALFNGTPRGRNWFYRLYTQAAANPEWFAQKLTVEDTGTLSAADIQAERASGMREELIQQEFYCDFAAGVPGAIYAKLIEQARTQGRILKMPYSGSHLVHTSWDIGAPRNTIVWFWQIVGREIHVIDCLYGFDGTLTGLVGELRAKGYPYGSHLLPHDAAESTVGMNFMQQLAQIGLPGLAAVPKTHSTWVGINYLKELFPALVFRAPECDKGIAGLEAYRTPDEQEGGASREEPVHDWASHPADALRMMAEAVQRGMVKFNASPVESEWNYPAEMRERRVRRPSKPLRVGG